MSSERQNVVANNRLADREFTVNINDSSAIANENAVDFQTLERNITDRMIKGMSIVLETVEYRVQIFFDRNA